MCLSQAVLSHLVRDIMQLCFSPSLISSVQSLSRVRLCDLMNRSTPGLPVHHQLPESTQTHVHQVSDAIQPSHPLSSPSPPGIFPSIQVFSNESTLRMRWPKYWSFSFSIINHKKNEIMSCAATWMDLEIIILSEVSQTKTSIK